MNFQLSAISRQLSVSRARIQGPRSKVQSQDSKLETRNSKLETRLRWWVLVVACALFPVIVLPACGKKTPVRPPEFVLPESTGDLTLDIAKGSVVLRWGRPQEYVDGSELKDLGGFIVLRATQDTQGQTAPFVKVATIPVEDRDRFRKAKRFTYTDTQLTAGTLYRYRVQSVTADGYESDLSNTVELVWKGGQ
jgi:hypothetical protein